jgi:hypothetical protein
VWIPKVLVKMRVGGMNNVSLKNRLAANRMNRKAWAVNGVAAVFVDVADEAGSEDFAVGG